MWQIILTIIFYIWLFAVLYLLYRHAVASGARQRKLQDALIDATLKSSTAALKVAEAIEELMAYLEKDRHAS